MSAMVATAAWRQAVGEVLGVALDEVAATATGRGVARAVALVAVAEPGALFDIEPSQHARALDQGRAA